MSTYQMREDGSVPGMRDNARGPVTIYSTSSLRRGTSRGLNFTERKQVFGDLDKKMDEAVEKVREKASKKYLKELRKILKGFNFSRHDIRISSSMGSTNLLIFTDGKPGYTPVYELQGRGFLVQQLQEVDQFLEGTWEWSSHLHDQSLTRY